jgi:hypothetical protein
MLDSSSYVPINWSRSFPVRLQGLTGYQVLRAAQWIPSLRLLSGPENSQASSNLKKTKRKSTAKSRSRGNETEEHTTNTRRGRMQGMAVGALYTEKSKKRFNSTAMFNSYRMFNSTRTFNSTSDTRRGGRSVMKVTKAALRSTKVTKDAVLDRTGYCVIPMSMVFMILLVVSQVYELSDVSHKNGNPSITESIASINGGGNMSDYSQDSSGILLTVPILAETDMIFQIGLCLLCFFLILVMLCATKSKPKQKEDKMVNTGCKIEHKSQGRTHSGIAVGALYTTKKHFHSTTRFNSSRLFKSTKIFATSHT